MRVDGLILLDPAVLSGAKMMTDRLFASGGERGYELRAVPTGEARS